MVGDARAILENREQGTFNIISICPITHNIPAYDVRVRVERDRSSVIGHRSSVTGHLSSIEKGSRHTRS